MSNYESILSGLGLSGGEAKVYLALISRQTLNAREVAQIAGLSKQMAYTVLQRLRERGLCSIVSGKTQLFHAIPPKIALSNLISGHEENVRSARDILDELEVSYEQARSSVRPLHYIEILKDRKLILDRFFNLIGSTQKQIDVFVTGPFATGAAMRNIPGEEALKRGVVIRALYESSEASDPVVLDHIVKFNALGEDNRLISNLPMKLVIFDAETVLCALRDPVTGKPGLTTLVVEHSDFARSMQILFDHYWNAALSCNDFILSLTRTG